MFSLKSKLGAALLAVALMCVMATVAASPATAQPYNCLPSCSSVDARFLAIANGTGFVTLSEPVLDLEISVPDGATSFTVGIFDGENRGVDGAGLSHWDLGSVGAVFTYTLYADPQGNRTGTTVVPLSGLPTQLSTTMPDNAWVDYTATTSVIAQAPSGNYFYYLRIELTSPGIALTNAFKVRTGGGQVGGSTLFPSPKPFSYIAGIGGNADFPIVYPNFPMGSLIPTTFDGSFSFYFDMPVTPVDITVWDGDFDRGKFDGTDLDTNDPDTPDAPFEPDWSTSDTNPEGVATGVTGTTGNPPDDRNPGTSLNSQALLKPPSVRYDLTFPDGQVFANNNPSGNQEWEQLRVADPLDPDPKDYSTLSFPPGVYKVRVQGVDMQNLNALLFPGRAVCVDEQGIPCDPLRIYQIGDAVFSDQNGNGIPDPGELGIPGVNLELYDYAGVLLKTTMTDANGQYVFEVDAGVYKVLVPGVEGNPAVANYDATSPGECTAPVTNDNVNCDFGFQPRGSIGNRVWFDANDNGLQDAGEPGLIGVLLELLDGNGDVIQTQSTGTDGIYEFTRVRAGIYTVRVATDTLSDNAVPTHDLDGVTTAHETRVTLGAAQQRTDVDFGYRGDASLGDRVWNDADGDSMQDSGEAGINGVTIYLFDVFQDQVMATAVTSGDGLYTFPFLLSSRYQVQIDTATLPPGYTQTYDLDGPTTANYVELDVFAGDNRTDVDFGYWDPNAATASVGDRVWNDANGNGMQDSGEAGINGVTVQLLNSGGTVIATTTTAGNGNYTFSNLSAGTYSVRVTPPAGFAPTFDADGVGTPNIATFTLTTGQTSTNVDFGYRGNLSVGDRVWNDADGDGTQDGTETGINGVTVQLLNSGGTVIATATTAGNGNYTFTNLAPGNYTVRVVSSSLPPGYTQTFDLDGVATAHQASFSLTASRAEVDFGYKPPVVCTAGTFKDTFTNASFSNNDGSLSWSGAWIENDSAGAGVSSGNVRVGTPVSGYMILNDYPDTGTQPSAARQMNLTGFASATLTVDYHIRGVEADDAVVIEVSNNGGATYTVLETLTGLTGNVVDSATYNISAYIASNTRIRFRISNNYGGDDDFFKVDMVKVDANCTPAATYSVGDRVWKDTDGDGVQDSGETGISNVTVQLVNSSNAVIGTDVTDSSGIYGFTNVAAGTYTVRVVSSSLPSGYTQTYDLDGVATAHQATFSLTANRTDVDFGYKPAPVCTSSGTFKDTFTNASFSNNEGTLSWSAAWVEVDSAGTGVSSGNVRVGTPVSGYLILNDYPDTGTQPSAARQMNLTGFASATLRVDYHIRGVDTADAAVIEVSKDGGATYTVLETFTGLTGNIVDFETYNISAYISSNTRIRFRISANYGGDDEFFKVDLVQVDASCTTTPPAQTYSVGDRVWKDADGDGVQDSGETGIANVTVQLLNSSGTVIASDVTDSNGIYGFTNVPAGTYSVKVVSSSLPSGYTPTFDLDGTSTPHIVTGPLTENHSDVDFGYKPPASSSCTSAGSFKDTFTNASFSNNEGSLSWAAAWVESDSAGSGVNSGNVTVGNPVSGYLILNDSPDTGTQPSAARQANLSTFASAMLSVDFHIRGVETDDAVVIEVSKDGGATYTALETLTGYTGTYIGSRTYDISGSIASNTRIRFRISANYGGDDDYFKVDMVRIDGSCTPAANLGSAGDRLWKDADRDGVQDSGEAGIVGVTVQLQNSSGAILDTTTTSSNGSYMFTNLAAGNYKVKVVSSELPSGMVPTYDKDGTSTAHLTPFSLTAGQDRTDLDFGYDN